MTGILIGSPLARTSALTLVPTVKSWVTLGLPCWIRPTFAVVPPMSNEIMLGRPIARPDCAVAITPAAGPDSTL
jgi:hypothetical protein